MATSSKRLIDQVEEALESPKVLDRDLVRELLEVTKALELGLADACRANLEMSAMDQNVIGATNALKDACSALLKAFTTRVEIEPPQVEAMVETQLALGRDLSNDRSRNNG